MLTRRWRDLLFVTLILLLGGCAGFVPLYGTDVPHPIDRSLTNDEIKSAIIEGAMAAGWQAKELTDNQVLATYRVRAHTVHVEIIYTKNYYTLSYRDSTGMKMFCTTRDKERARNLKVSGHDNCPGRPAYIHQSYKAWLDTLNASIQFMLNST